MTTAADSRRYFADIYDIAQRYVQRPIEEAFLERFGRAMPDTLNASHQMTAERQDQGRCLPDGRHHESRGDAGAYSERTP